VAVAFGLGTGLGTAKGKGMITRGHKHVVITDDYVQDIVSFLERVVPRGPAEADYLAAIILAMDPKAGDHDR
jgi:hypothetical protein